MSPTRRTARARTDAVSCSKRCTTGRVLWRMVERPVRPTLAYRLASATLRRSRSSTLLRFGLFALPGSSWLALLRSSWLRLSGLSGLALLSSSSLALLSPSPSAFAQDSEPAAMLFNEGEVRFLQHMIMHHEQAVVMAAMVPSRTDRQEFVRFTGYVGRAQAAEISLMQSLLDLAAERGQTLPAPMLHDDPPMAGMLSSTQIAALEAASGREFERLWIEGMIYHHQGAIDMAFAQQLAQLENGRRPYGLATLVEDIIVEQRAEIDRMRNWLEEWGLSRRQ